VPQPHAEPQQVVGWTTGKVSLAGVEVAWMTAVAVAA
jgi:hypothetical protein